jgi:site-specific DNA recombinase
MKACSYDRVSTARQAEGVEVETCYLARIHAHCQRRDWELGPHFTDPGKSGKNAERPGLQAAIQWAVDHKGVIVFYDLTRFSRSLRDAVNIAEQLKQHGAALSSATEAIDTTDDNPAGILTFHVLAACAEFQRRLIGAKIKHKNAEIVAAKGYRTNGKQPYGWQLVEGERTAVPDEQRLIARVRQWRQSGLSQRLIAERLNAQGWRTRSGRLWIQKDVSRVPSLKLPLRR